MNIFLNDALKVGLITSSFMTTGRAAAGGTPSRSMFVSNRDAFHIIEAGIDAKQTPR